MLRKKNVNYFQEFSIFFSLPSWKFKHNKKAHMCEKCILAAGANTPKQQTTFHDDLSVHIQDIGLNTHFFVKMFSAVFCCLLTVVMCSYGDLELLKDDQQRTNQLLSQRLEEQNIQNLGLRYSTLLSWASCTLFSLASSGTLLSLASGTQYEYTHVLYM